MQNTEKRKLKDYVQFEDKTILWTASLILLKHLQQPQLQQQLKGKRVLELGSGLGHLGFGLYKLGCHVTCTERPCELAALQASLEQQKQLKKPPLDAALEHLGASNASARNAADNSPADDTEAGSIQAISLEWGEQGYLNSPLSTQNTGAFDVIICSELYYLEHLFPEILWTMKKFSRPGTVVWSIFIDRPFSFFFFSLLSDEKCWTVEAIEEFDDLNINQDTQVYMHRITYTPGQESSHS